MVVPAMALVLGLVPTPRAAEPANHLGKKVPDFKLKDITGKDVALVDFRDKKAVVLVFVELDRPFLARHFDRHDLPCALAKRCCERAAQRSWASRVTWNFSTKSSVCQPEAASEKASFNPSRNTLS